MAWRMRPVSAAFLDALRTAHSFVTVVTVYPTTGPQFDIGIDAGQVTLDRTAQVRARCDLSLSDPSLYPVTDTSPLHVYGTEVGIQRGIRFPDDSVELVGLGRYRVQTVSRSRPGGQVTIQGQDRSAQVADERFTAPVTVAAGLKVDQIQDLITDVYPAAAFDVGPDLTSGDATVFDRDRWDAISQIAKSIGYEVWIDADLVWQIQPTPDPRTTPTVWLIDTGPTGVLVSSENSVTRDSVPNGVVAVGEASDGTIPVSALVTDDDPSSPTLWGGPYGRVPRFYSSPLIKTTGQATSAATALLNDVLGAFRSVNFQSVPNPAIEAGDVITIQDGDDPASNHIFDSITIGLDADGTMTGESRAQVESTE